ncbi:PP-loop superfamily ATPase [Cenarchaeum symbiosum A]|uniref:7-cyano-7-deazaguanine synthase n=1 Tax=Cenarchaeum symbiosum (strain A) TaxID=414004 RepID=A0RYT7_CENSY|nr:PP-loop superfamily ATPase [Cenarchaeum symbiosum A]
MKAVVVFSGGIDSLCMCAHLRKKYRLYGITFLYGQRARRESRAARRCAEIAGLKEHRTAKMEFMGDLYGGSNVLTDSRRRIPASFEGSIVVPVRNAVFLSVAAAWAYSIGAALVAYGAHTGDGNYPDCRPAFAKRMESALNLGEADAINKGTRKALYIWSPYREGLSKADLLKTGHDAFGDEIFQAWSCYADGKKHCGKCESCSNRKAAFAKAGIDDATAYAA